ncbi:hypothetical protein [Oleiagrimonas sp. C23AA]|uniref:hypothetical protein n=1 Tax=Oleiagrimonas sp. C23AA TaxID=2719047 RepID=UPI0014244BE2|nr:hypothetical protein [Oleiagrimonas sp. C23AA]NII11562.1 hypothetical protein [Oleiagrimonas sp. C23AA]
MRKLALFAVVALTGAIGLSACSGGHDKDQQQAQTQQQAAVQKPTDPNDTAAWNKYLGSLLQNNMQGMTADRPYAYMIPAGDSDADKAARQRQLDSISDVVARGVTPGNLIAFAGADSTKTADAIVQSFKGARKGTFKGVIVLFIGDQADKQRVADVINPTGAKFRFVQM